MKLRGSYRPKVNKSWKGYWIRILRHGLESTISEKVNGIIRSVGTICLKASLWGRIVLKWINDCSRKCRNKALRLLRLKRLSKIIGTIKPLLCTICSRLRQIGILRFWPKRRSHSGRGRPAEERIALWFIVLKARKITICRSARSPTKIQSKTPKTIPWTSAI